MVFNSKTKNPSEARIVFGANFSAKNKKGAADEPKARTQGARKRQGMCVNEERSVHPIASSAVSGGAIGWAQSSEESASLDA